MPAPLDLRILDGLLTATALLRAGNPHHDAQGHFTDAAHEGRAAARAKHLERRKKRLAKLKQRLNREHKALKAGHAKDRKDLARDHAKQVREKRAEHRKERKEHVAWEEREKRELAREHAKDRNLVEREHAARLKAHAKDAPKRHAEIDAAHKATAEKIDRLERRAKSLDRRHAREIASHDEKRDRDWGWLKASNEKFYASERAKLEAGGATKEDLAAHEAKVAAHRERYEDPHAGLRKDIEDRHAAERAKADSFVGRAPGLREKLARRTAAEHRKVDRAPQRAEKAKQKAHAALAGEHADRREEQAAEHRQVRKDLRQQQRDERASLGQDFRDERASLRDQQRDERREFVAYTRQEASDRGFRHRGSEPKSPAERPRDLANADPKEVEAAWNELGDHWRQSLAPQERLAAEQYTGRYFEGVNNLARKGKVGKVADADNQIDDARARAIMADADSAIAKASLPAASVVYRGIGDIGKLGLKPDGLVGATVRDKGFLSTSLTPKVAEGFARGKAAAILRISAPKGAPGISMAGVSAMPREREVLFARGASVRITGASRDASGRHVLDAELSYESVSRSWAAGRSAESPAGGGTDRDAVKFGWREGDVEIIPGEARGFCHRGSNGGQRRNLADRTDRGVDGVGGQEVLRRPHSPDAGRGAGGGGVLSAERGRTVASPGRGNRFSPHRTHKPHSAEDILRHVLRSLGWTSAWKRRELTEPEVLALVDAVRRYGRQWFHHEAEVLLKVHGRRIDDGAGAGRDAGVAGGPGGPRAGAPLGPHRDGGGGVRGGLPPTGDGGASADGDDAGRVVARSLSATMRGHVARFFERARGFVKELIVAGAMALAGPDGLDADDLAEADRQAAVQHEFLANFERDVALRTPPEIAEPSAAALENAMSAAQFAARAESYAGATWVASQQINRKAVIRGGKAVKEARFHRMPDPEAHACAVCLEQSQKGWQPIGALLPVGDSTCLGISCDCYFSFLMDDGSIFITSRGWSKAA